MAHPPAVLLLGEQRNAGERGAGIPFVVHAENVRGIGRRHAAQRDQTATDERFESAGLGLRFEQSIERGGTGRETIEEHRLATARIADDPIDSIDAQREPADAVTAPGCGALPLQGVRHQIRMLGCEQRERHEPARADQQPLAGSSVTRLVPPSHLTVAPEPDGAHRHRFHHRAKPAHGGAAGVDPGPAVGQQRIVGRRASDVGHERVALAGQVRCADQACRGSGENRLDRLQSRDLRPDQRSVAAHHHHWSGNAQDLERAVRGLQQALDDRHEPGVQHAGHGPARPVEPARQLVPARHRPAGALAQTVAHRVLVLRIAHREHAGHRKRVDGTFDIGDRPIQSREVQRLACAPRRIMATANPHARIATQRTGDSGPRCGSVVEADEHQPDPSALPFDERVGGQRRRQRDERDRGGFDTRVVEHHLGGAADADRQIMPRGERLRRRDDLPGLLVEQNRVGVRAAGIDSEQDGHGHGDSVLEKPGSKRQYVGIGGIAGHRRVPASPGESRRSYVRRPAETGNSDRETAGNHDPQYAPRLDGQLQARQFERR